MDLFVGLGWSLFFLAGSGSTVVIELPREVVGLLVGIGVLGAGAVSGELGESRLSLCFLCVGGVSVIVLLMVAVVFCFFKLWRGLYYGGEGGVCGSFVGSGSSGGE